MLWPGVKRAFSARKEIAGKIKPAPGVSQARGRMHATSTGQATIRRLMLRPNSHGTVLTFLRVPSMMKPKWRDSSTGAQTCQMAASAPSSLHLWTFCGQLCAMLGEKPTGKHCHVALRHNAKPDKQHRHEEHQLDMVNMCAVAVRRSGQALLRDHARDAGFCRHHVLCGAG